MLAVNKDPNNLIILLKNNTWTIIALKQIKPSRREKKIFGIFVSSLLTTQRPHYFSIIAHITRIGNLSSILYTCTCIAAQNGNVFQ